MTFETASTAAPIISIAIPTYNRSRRLEDTLTRLSAHIEIFQDWVEVVVSDNASTDDTPDIVTAFSQRTGKAVRYGRNASNLGIDGNIHAVSRLCTGRFLLLMSDDDLLLPGALTRLRDLVDGTPGLLFCFVNGGSFTGTYDPTVSLPALVPLAQPLVTCDPNELLATIGVWSTFISSFFVERQAWLDVPKPESFIGSDIYLTHILFRLLMAKRGRPCVITSEQLLAARGEYGGSFRVFHAFGYSLLSLVTRDAPALGLDPRAMRRVKLGIIRRALPPMVLMIRRGGAKHRALGLQELQSLLRFTWWEPLAWVFLLPIALLPNIAIEGLIRFKRKLFKRSVFA
jgi:abequosyltransferase